MCLLQGATLILHRWKEVILKTRLNILGFYCLPMTLVTLSDFSAFLGIFLSLGGHRDYLSCSRSLVKFILILFEIWARLLGELECSFSYYMLYDVKVIIHMSRSEVSLVEQETIENVSLAFLNFIKKFKKKN